MPGPRIWLPTHKYAGPHPMPQNEREDLLQRMYNTRSLIVGAEQMEIEELRDHVQAQEGKASEGYYDKHNRNKAPVSDDKRRQAIGSMKEFADWRRKRKMAAGLMAKVD